MYLVLIDTRIPDYSRVIESLSDNTQYVLFDFYSDTLETIQIRIPNEQLYDSISIVQHNYYKPTFQFLDSLSPSMLYNVKNDDPQLTSWEPFIGFIQWLKREHGANYVDFMACDVWSNPNWVYVIETIRTLGVYIRASINLTGDGGDFILESDNFNTIGVYFTNDIVYYGYCFASMGLPMFYHVFANFTRYVLPDSNPGIVSTKYIGTLGTNGVPAQTSYNILSITSTIGATALLMPDHTVRTTGYALGSPIPSSIVSSLTNITKVVSTQYAFAALRLDGRVFSWGSTSGGLDIRTTTDSSIVSYNSVSSSLVNIVDIVEAQRSFAAIDVSGNVILWGEKLFGAYPYYVNSSINPVANVAKIKGANKYFYCVKNDGNACWWGCDNSLNGTRYDASGANPIVDCFPVAGDSLSVIFMRYNTTTGLYQLTSPTGSILYTIPSGVSILRTHVYYSSVIYATMFFLLSNKTVLRQVANAEGVFISPAFVYTNTTDIITTGYSNAYALITNGAVVVYNNTLSGGSLTDASYGLPAGKSVSSGVYRLVSTQTSIGALKTDNTFVWWGQIGNYTSVDFPTQNPALYYNTSNQIANVYSVMSGFVSLSIDGSFCNVNTTATTYSGGPASGTTETFFNDDPSYNIHFEPNGSGLFAIQIPYKPVLSPQYGIPVNSPRTISYYVSKPSQMGYWGRTYTLQDSSGTIYSTYIPTKDVNTYVFSNVVLTTTKTYSVVDTTNPATYTMVSFVIPVGFPYPPTITSVSETGTLGTIRLHFTPPVENGGSTITTYSYSINGGTYQNANTTSSPITISGLVSDTSFQFVLIATNSTGNSQPSLPSSTYSYTARLYSSAPDVSLSVIYMPKVSIEWNGSVFVLLHKNETDGTTVYKYSKDGTTWQSGDPPTSTLDATVAKWTGDRLFVGGESSGNNIIITSKDGIHYSVSKTANGLQLHGLETNLEYRNTIVFPRTVHLALGGVSGETYRIAYSLDNSESWTPISGVSANDAAWNGRIWVAAGTRIATSSDGIHWIDRGVIFSDYASAVSWSKELHLWVAIGKDASGNNVAYSVDGVHWLSAVIPGFGYGNTVLWNGDTWVAGGKSDDGRTIATSSDGKTWTSTTGGFVATESTRVEWDGTQWTMFGNYGCATSANGIDWYISSARQPTPVYTDLFFLQESSGNTYYRSLDGQTWETHSTITDMSLSFVGRFSRNISNEAVAHIQPITIATGEGINTMAYSADGIYWTGLGSTVFTTRANRAVWNGRLWVAVGTGGFWVATSYDGLIWTGRDSALLSEGYDVAWNGERFIAAGEEGMAYSADGIHWQLVGGEVKSTSVVWTGRAWMVYTANGRATSTDGLTWTTDIVDIAERHIPVVLRNSVLVDVSNGSGTFSDLFGDSIESQTINLNSKPSAVCFDGETTFVADVSGNIAYLTNDAAISDTKLFQTGMVDSRLSSIYSACWNQQFVLFGGTGGITYGRMGTAWQYTNAGQLFSTVHGVASNSGYGFVHIPNAVYLHTNDILRVVGPKAYTFPDETALHFNVRPMDL